MNTNTPTAPVPQAAAPIFTIKRTLKGNVFNKFMPDAVNIYTGTLSDLAYRLEVQENGLLAEAKTIDELLAILGSDFELDSTSQPSRIVFDDEATAIFDTAGTIGFGSDYKKLPLVCGIFKDRLKGKEFIAFDNTTGDFWVESFKTRDEAVAWCTDKSVHVGERVTEQERLSKRLVTLKNLVDLNHPKIKSLPAVSQAFFQYKVENRIVGVQNSLEELKGV